MERKGKEIVGVDVNELINLLNKALSDEWLAYYQYWVGAKVVKGMMKEAVIAELTQHAGDELRHAEMLAARILQLGGIPVLKPENWYKLTNCGYEAPEDPDVMPEPFLQSHPYFFQVPEDNKELLLLCFQGQL